MQNMSLSLSVHPITQRKQSHFGSVLSHFKPQRSCTYRGMLSRKQNQNSATPTTVHLQGKRKKKGCSWFALVQTNYDMIEWTPESTFPPLFKDRAVLLIQHCHHEQPQRCCRKRLASSAELAGPRTAGSPAHCCHTRLLLAHIFLLDRNHCEQLLKTHKPPVSKEHQIYCQEGPKSIPVRTSFSEQSPTSKTLR